MITCGANVILDNINIIAYFVQDQYVVNFGTHAFITCTLE